MKSLQNLITLLVSVTLGYSNPIDRAFDNYPAGSTDLVNPPFERYKQIHHLNRPYIYEDIDIIDRVDVEIEFDDELVGSNLSHEVYYYETNHFKLFLLELEIIELRKRIKELEDVINKNINTK